LVIDHVLANTGNKTIETDVYNHNFFVIDNQPTGPDFVVRFPFELTTDKDLKGYGEVHGYWSTNSAIDTAPLLWSHLGLAARRHSCP
jgi:hypothetical protein